MERGTDFLCPRRGITAISTSNEDVGLQQVIGELGCPRIRLLRYRYVP
jgi:hypothetical protein